MKVVGATDLVGFMGVRVGVANRRFFLGQSIGMDETNTFQLKCLASMTLWASQVWAALGVRVGVEIYFWINR